MSVALVRSIQFLPKVSPRSSRRLWLGLTSFIAVFLMGYVGAGALAFMGRLQVLVGLTSAVFFGGAFFVLLTIYLTTRLNSDLSASTLGQQSLIEELEIKNSALESFCYATSHDLKSPLVTIRGYLGWVRSDLDNGNPEAAEIGLATIESAAQRMQEVIEELLALGVAGKIVCDPECLRLDEVVAEVVRLPAAPVRLGGIQLQVAAEMPEVLGDRGRLVTVFENLLENAAKFTGKQSTPVVRIDASRDRGGMVRCTVSDNGVGIDARDPDRVFDIFTRLDPEVEGHGVGLALVKRIVEAHGGAIQVSSAGPDLGCTFEFTLPAA